jgi:hypothetical protein
VVGNFYRITLMRALFTRDGVAQGIHNAFPYALANDNAGDFDDPVPPLSAGSYALSVSGYAEAGALGTVVGEASFVLTVVEVMPATDAGVELDAGLDSGI